IAFELLDDLAVAAHRALEALQVAVDDEDQVVELLARGETDGAERFGLVHLAIAAEHPDFAVARLRQAARLQILQVARHVDGLDRAEAHRDRGELPVLRHQPRMRIGRDALAVDFAAEVEQPLLREAAFHERARIDARRGMALEIDQVTAMAVLRRVPEVLLPGAEQRAERREGGDVAAELVVRSEERRVGKGGRTWAALEDEEESNRQQ